MGVTHPGPAKGGYRWLHFDKDDRHLFARGKNEAKGMDLAMVSTQLATFSGQCLTDFSKGNAHTLGDILQELNTQPVRLYLETRWKTEVINFFT